MQTHTKRQGITKLVYGLECSKWREAGGVIHPDDKSMWRMGIYGEIFSLQELME